MSRVGRGAVGPSGTGRAHLGPAGACCAHLGPAGGGLLRPPRVRLGDQAPAPCDDAPASVAGGAETVSSLRVHAPR
ncbi:hypothetical protein BKI49_21075 [Streptomyces sp. Tue6028]|nr:hypothetical protein BKI49_21075 [Streptomyces sp. Tue6028]